MIAGFETLRIWQEAHQLMLEIHKISRGLPRDEKFKIGNQMERSSSSVADNIAEGYSSYYYKDKQKGMFVARKEAGETQNHIKSIESKRYLPSQVAVGLINRYEGLMKGINGYIRYINNKIQASKQMSP